MADRRTIPVSVTPGQPTLPGGRVQSGSAGVGAAQRPVARSEPDFLIRERARLVGAGRRGG